MFRYQIVVEGASINGHPVSRLEMKERAAESSFNELSVTFPQHEVVMYKIERREIRRMRPPERGLVTQCPRGHQKIRSTGRFLFCSVCDWKEEQR